MILYGLDRQSADEDKFKDDWRPPGRRQNQSRCALYVRVRRLQRRHDVGRAIAIEYITDVSHNLSERHFTLQNIHL